MISTHIPLFLDEENYEANYHKDQIAYYENCDILIFSRCVCDLINMKTSIKFVFSEWIDTMTAIL